MSKIRFIGEMQRTSLGPEDVVLVKVPHLLSPQIVERIRSSIQKELGYTRKILILDRDTEIAILSPEAAD